MGKSEYFEVNKLPGEKEQPQIVLDAEKIYDLLLRAEVMMTKVDRVRYCNRAIGQILDIISEFTLAYDFDDDREYHLKKMCAHVAMFLRTMRIIADSNVIHIKSKYDVETPDQIKLALMNHIAKLDEGVTKWRKSFIKSKKDKGKKGTTGING